MILRELERSRQIIRGGDVLVTRFVVSTPDGEFSVVADLQIDPKKHEELLAKLYAFLIWKQASAFVMSCESARTKCRVLDRSITAQGRRHDAGHQPRTAC